MQGAPRTLSQTSARSRGVRRPPAAEGITVHRAPGTPELLSLIPDTRGGVWDFAHALAAELGACHQVMAIARGDAGALAQANAPAVLLHLSGYGYAKRGAPLWLVRSLVEHRQHLGSLGIFFHELYALRWPWSSAFWISPLQQYVAGRLAAMADFWITTCDKHAAWLRRHAGHKPHAVLPIPSNIGELPTLGTHRSPVVVVFGSASLRGTAYRAAGERFFDWAAAHRLEIHDIGKEITEPRLAERLRSRGVVRHGFLAHSVASTLLATARYGIVMHRAAELAKSSIFAAYCAHGVCPIVLARGYRAADGLHPGRHYFAGVPAHDSGGSQGAEAAEAAWRWYGQHRLARHGETVTALLREVSRT
jgi:hypothetical protein